MFPWRTGIGEESAEESEMKLLSFVQFLSIAESNLGLNLLEHPLLGRLGNILNAIHLQIMLFTVEYPLGSECLEAEPEQVRRGQDTLFT